MHTMMRMRTMVIKMIVIMNMLRLIRKMLMVLVIFVYDYTPYYRNVHTSNEIWSLLKKMHEFLLFCITFLTTSWSWIEKCAYV